MVVITFSSLSSSYHQSAELCASAGGVDGIDFQCYALLERFALVEATRQRQNCQEAAPAATPLILLVGPLFI